MSNKVCTLQEAVAKYVEDGDSISFGGFTTNKKPMAARVSQKVGAEADPTNFLLMHAMGPNVAGVIGTAVAAGTFMAIFGVK